jgi:hypothetical protein
MLYHLVTDILLFYDDKTAFGDPRECPCDPKVGHHLLKNTALYYEDSNLDSKMVVAVDRWSLFGGACWLRFECTFLIGIIYFRPLLILFDKIA